MSTHFISFNFNEFDETVRAVFLFIFFRDDVSLHFFSSTGPGFTTVRMNHEFMEYMGASYPDTPSSEFKVVDMYVCVHGG
jgi:hypothetical protein